MSTSGILQHFSLGASSKHVIFGILIASFSASLIVNRVISLLKTKRQKSRKHLRDFRFEEVLNDNNLSYICVKGQINGEVAVLKFSAKNLTTNELMQLLPCLDLTLHSESGAEYAYYHSELHSPALPWVKTRSGCSYQIEIICPASDRQIERARYVPFRLIEETEEVYEARTRPFIETLTSDGSLQWLYNILEKKKETERMIFDSQGDGDLDFLVCIDTKWKHHPDPKVVPQEQWKGLIRSKDLYCLGLVQKRSLRTIRDLTAVDIPLLQAVHKEGLAAIERVYGVSKEEIRVFIHYQPQFYLLHVHFAHISNELGVLVDKAHLLTDVIQNLALQTDFYKKRTISYSLRETEKLYKLINSC